MPDLITHTAAAYLITRHQKYARYRVVFYLGAILPDILSRPFYILFPAASKISTATHTPIFIFVFCIFLSQFFQAPDRKSIFITLLSGSGLHFVMDFFQLHLLGGYYWLFPFSWNFYEIGLFWPDDAVRFIPFWLLSIIAIEIFLVIARHKKGC